MYKYLFGPVPSRRLGMSLGIDLVPKKVCSLDCVYCEVGKTTALTLQRKEYIPVPKIINELTHYFEHHPEPDYFTFSGAGEPTLNSGLEEIIRFVKAKKPNIPVAVLTNGTLLFDANVRKSLLMADVVLPSLDAATQQVFEKINRPVADLTIAQYINGIADFRKEYKGKIWLEIFILPDYNQHTEELSALKEAIKLIQPDSIQLNTLDRPGTVDGLRSANDSELKAVADYLGFANTTIIAAAISRKEQKAFRSDMAETILETILRRPCTPDDLQRILCLHINELNKYLDVLEAEDKIESVRMNRGVFYQIKQK